MVMRKSTEKTLILNCMMMAQKDLLISQKISKEVFISETIKRETRVMNKGRKKL